MRQHLWLGNERDAVHPAQRSAIEDMVVDLRAARLAPAVRDVARVEEKRAGGVIIPRAVARDLRDRHGIFPHRRVTHHWHQIGRASYRVKESQYRKLSVEYHSTHQKQKQQKTHTTVM